MPKFNVGDTIRLAPVNNGSGAFTTLNPMGKYLVEALGQNCSRCANAGVPHNGSVKVQGRFFCAEAFVLHTNAQQVPAQASNQPRQVMMVSKDPYSGASCVSGTEWDDNIADANHEDFKKLPTIEQLNEDWYKKLGIPRPQ